MKLKTLIPKSEARRLVVQRRSDMSEFDIRTKTKSIIERLASTDEFNFAKRIHCYVSSRKGEVDTRQLINFMTGWGKSVVLPKLHKPSKSFHRFNFMGWDHLVKNSEGYWEPNIALNENMDDIDLVIVPSVAISVHGMRVGYGGGYYDKLLKDTFAPKIVLAFELQIFDYIETDPRNVRVDKIITERRIIDTRTRDKKFG
ncbi:MAG: 5-formyltetrahydrofolate cyclo-ligase [Bacteroidota bacterium]